MKKMFALSAAAVALVGGSALAATQELQVTPGPFSLVANAPQTVSVTFTGLSGGTPYTPVAFRVQFGLQALQTNTWANDLLVTALPPAATGLAQYNLYRSATTVYGTLPNLGGDFLFPAGMTAAQAIGTWTFTFTDTYSDAADNGVPGEPEAILSNIRISLQSADPPASFITITPATNTGEWTTSTSTVAANTTRWYQLSVPTAVNGTGLGNALDIDMVGTALTPNNDASMAMYNPTNNGLVAIDNNFGPGELPQISFGKGIRPASGNGQVYSGQDGNALAAGNYFIAVRGGNATFGNFYDVTGGSADAGPMTLRVRYYDSYTSGVPDQIYTNIINVGNVGSSTAGVENVQTSTFNADGGSVQWFKFTTTVSTADNASYYLDIDTEDSALGVTEVVGGLMDTEIGVYDSIGTMLVNDDDSGNGYRSALSFGDSVNIRPAIAPVAPALAGVARNGRNGALAAGDYWLAVATYDVTFGTTEWNATSAAAAATAGERKVSFRSNLPVPPSCTCCNLSNVAGANQSTTPDDSLTADDIIVFLGWYFANDNRANVAGPNQSTTPDNALTADDIIVFLGRYFQGC